MAKTHTYTARSTDDPSLIVIFTVSDQSLTIEPDSPGGIEQVLRSSTTDEESDVNNSPRAWLKTLTLLKGPNKPRLHLVDVDAGVEKDSLRLMAWGRSSDQRWLPIAIVMEHVDNPEAARAFVKELNRRKMSAMQRARFFAWIGARAYWFLAGTFTALVAMISLRYKRS